jgi:hypothetical protein
MKKATRKKPGKTHHTYDKKSVSLVKRTYQKKSLPLQSVAAGEGTVEIVNEGSMTDETDGHTDAEQQNFDIVQGPTQKFKGLPPVTRAAYPQAFPEQAVREIIEIVKRKTWLEDRAALGRCIYELFGASCRIWLGDPDGQRITAAPIDPKQLSQALYVCREEIMKAVIELRNPALVKAVGTSEDRRACTALLEWSLVPLAWLRKATLEASSNEV